jgi:hypothetical protein
VDNRELATGWNLKELLERLDGDQEFLRELLRVFRADSQLNLQKAKDPCRNADLTADARGAFDEGRAEKSLHEPRGRDCLCAGDRGWRERWPPFTMSVGLALSSDFQSYGTDEIIHEADLSLYAAKEAGRNCARMARPDGDANHLDVAEKTAALRRR